MNAIFVFIASSAVVLAMLSHYQARKNAKRFRVLAEGGTDLVSLHDVRNDWRFVYASPAFHRITGYTPGELVGRPGDEFVHPADLPQLLESRARIQSRQDEVSRVECRFRTKSGAWLWLEIEKISNTDFVKRGQALVVARDISRKKAIEDQLQKLEYQDALTGLPNRRAFIGQLQASLARCGQAGKSVALVRIDVDGLNVLNGLRGHAVGDQALRALAARLTSLTQNRYSTGRFGDDEFMVLLEQDDDVLFDAPRAVTRMIEDLIRPLEIDGESVYLTVSAGLAVYPLHASSTETLLAAAHAATQAARLDGKNCWRVFKAEYTHEQQRSARALMELRRAYDEKRLELHYQPKVDLTTGACMGFEALLRVSTAEGICGAQPFVQAAEEFGFIHTLTEWVINTAFAQSEQWHARGITVPIAVNISVRSLHADSGFLHFIERAVNENPQIVDRVELEITESVVATDFRSSVTALRRLRQLGFRLHVDDFGSGHSSLSYLCGLPFHSIKVDRSFVLGLPDTRPEVVKGIVQLATSLGMSVVAEGVETPAQLLFLESLGCKHVQGFLFARPMPASDAAAFATRLGAPAYQLKTIRPKNFDTVANEPLARGELGSTAGK